MQYDELLTHKAEILSLFNSYGVENPRVFGSTITGKQHSDSDIDFLVSWPVRHSLFDRMRLKNALTTLLKSKVDLVTDKSLYHGVRNQVMQTAKAL
ncbi:MAG: nucleotidyltransferase domain-containing protein [Gammaproteobacteria bacterium]|nr:nucleotidyltransferase domain-containing protein [Gammaproteobacteria bacterium]